MLLLIMHLAWNYLVRPVLERISLFFLAYDATLTGGYNVAWNPPDLWHLGKEISASNSKIKLNRNQMMKNSSFLPAMVQRKKLLPQNHTTCHGPFSGAIDTWISVASEPNLSQNCKTITLPHVILSKNTLDRALFRASCLIITPLNSFIILWFRSGYNSKT